MSLSREDGRRRARHWPTGAGQRSKLSYADLVRVRELYAIGRVGVPKPLTAEEIANKFGVSHMTIRRAVAMHEVEVEARRKLEELLRCRSLASSSVSTPVPSSS